MTSGDTLQRKEFERRRAAIQDVVYPKLKAYILVSENTTSDEPFIRELAYRERPNRLGIIQTIIFLRHFTKCGFEISGYIDYAHRLLTEDWTPYFRSGRRVWPRMSDLGYFHWRHGTVMSNISRNYKPIMDTNRGLLFQNRHDNQIVCPDPARDPGVNTAKTRLYSSNYTQIELYDHLARKKT